VRSEVYIRAGYPPLLANYHWTRLLFRGLALVKLHKVVSRRSWDLGGLMGLIGDWE
jgi:hypothetical protein